MEIIIKNYRKFSEIQLGEIFEASGLFYLKVTYDRGYNLDTKSFIPFESNEKVIPHTSKLIVY